MRSLMAVAAMLGSIAAMTLIIGYSASEGWIRLREDEEDVSQTLLLGEVFGDVAMQELSKATFNERFVTPCLGIPLLTDGQRTGRSEHQLGVGERPVTLLLARASRAQAEASMQEVARDVENDCARGVTVGRVTSATTVYPVAETGGDEAYGVVFSEAGAGDDQPSRAVVFARYDNLIVRVEDLTNSRDASALEEAIDYAGLVMARAADPPSAEEVEAARLAQRSTFEKYTEDVNGYTERALTFEGQVPLVAGLGVAGLSAGMLLALGAMLNRDPEGPLATSRSQRRVERDDHPTAPQQTKLVLVTAPAVTAADLIEEPADEFESGPEPEIVHMPPEPERVTAPEAIVSSSRDEVERKLEVLREARRAMPRPEPVTPLPIEPEVDWTARLTDEDGALPGLLAHEPSAPSAEPAPRAVDRKQLLRKLRVQYPVED